MGGARPPPPPAAVGMAGLAARLEEVRFAPQTSWFLLLLRTVPPQVIGDTILVASALWNAVRRRPVDGAFHIVPFDGGGPDARSAARRALIVAAISLPPNTYVIDISKDGGYLLVHQLVGRGRQPGRGDRQWPL
ncbi:MAG: hypothetical protein NVSMB65_08350 [Chloroflexota bacterium]